MEENSGSQPAQPPSPSQAPSGPSKLQLLAVVFLFLTLVVAVGVYSLPPATAPSPTPAASSPTPTNYSEPTPVIVAAAKPPLPEQSVIDAKYREVRQAVKSRDYTAFRQLISSRIAKYFDNPGTATYDIRKILSNDTGVDESGNIITSPAVSGGDGRFAFQRSAPYEVLFDAPPVEYLGEPSVEYNTKYAPDGVETSAIVTYQTLPNSPINASGDARFDYENGSWKYSRESWTVLPRPPAEFGDAVFGHEVRFDYSASKDYVRDPVSYMSEEFLKANQIEAIPVPQKPAPAPFSVVRIRAGEAVTWVNVTGMLFSYLSSSAPWDSGYLYGDNFTRTFPSKGYCLYYLNSAKPYFYYSVRGVVIVE